MAAVAPAPAPDAPDDALEASVDEARHLISAMLKLHDPAVADYVELDAASYRRLKDAVLDLSQVSKTETFLADVNFVLQLILRLDQHASDRSVEGQAETLARLDRALQVLLIRAEDAVTSQSPQAAVLAILGKDGLEGVPAAEVASLLGITEKTLRSWRDGGEVRPANRLRLFTAAQLVRALRTSFTARGVLMWMDTSLTRMGDRTPREVLRSGSPEDLESLVALARGNRG